MISIIIDFSKIILNSSLKLLEKKIKPYPKKLKHTIGLILTIPTQIHSKLLKQEAGQNRVDFMNSDYFVNSIINHTYFQYEPNLKICELYEPDFKILSSILDSILHHLPNDFIISIILSIENKPLYEQLIYESFKNPNIIKHSKLGISFKNHMLILEKINNLSSYDAKNEVDFVLKKYKTKPKTNKLKFKLNDKTIKKLKHFSNIGNSINENGTITQKEIAGCFKIQKMNKNFIYILELCDDIKIGSEEEVDMVDCRFGFHSHPIVLYDLYNFEFGWPSNLDFLIFLKSQTLFHMIITKEGVYILSLSKEWSKKKFTVSNNLENFILQHYSFTKTNNKLSLKSYIKKINEIKYQNKKIFNLEFKVWNKIKDTFFIYEYQNKLF